ncbi:RILP-like protein 1 isoform X2 [Haliotis rubra]|uniref:RILP-like protein 1 isoform X2 n=1 Tax=Haliotis rubra TaxID=36100 RepID=UPI001EE51733|nr:RILP-like protein 1 isoform X2 [Haliotis rubra]
MERQFSDRSMSSDPSISVTDVYDQAAGIAQEFDKLITTYGNDAVTDLMPKVIKALEQLETLASRYETENDEINGLRLLVDNLKAEKAGKAQERARFEQELEQIEENWQSEVKKLLWDISQLQDENRRLRDNLQDQKQAIVDKVVLEHQQTEEQEIKVLTKLKETVDKQREELRTLRREMEQRGVDCEALGAQLERVAKMNSDLRRKNQTHKKQTAVLLDERADIEVQLKGKEEEVEKIKEILKEQENMDQLKLARDVRRKRNGIHGDEDDDDEGASEETMEDIASRLNHQGKMIIDLTDPNRPRFTMQELRQVLMERNELKTKLIEVEEELSVYKPKEESGGRGDATSSYRGEEVLVYGPINREPDEKVPGAKREGGIRKFFGYIFGDGPSPRPRERRQRSATFAK